MSLYVNFGAGDTQREADIRDYAAFFDRLRSANEWPTTSQPSVGDFIEVYEPLLAEGRDVVSIHISGGLSGTHESARQAREALERDGKGGERVHVMDSSTAAGGLGMVVLAAARSAARGADAASVVAAAKQAREELKMWFAIDTLEFLKRSGRIGAASAWIGSTLKIKPILTVESEISPIERVRTSARAFERMVDYARQRKASDADGWVVQHIQSDEQGRKLADRCRDRLRRLVGWIEWCPHRPGPPGRRVGHGSPVRVTRRAALRSLVSSVRGLSGGQPRSGSKRRRLSQAILT